MRLLAVAATALVLTTQTLSAQSASLIDRFYSVFDMGAVLEILREEGVASGKSMTEDGSISNSPAWTARLNAIYREDKAWDAFKRGLERIKDADSSVEALAFFEGELGAKIVQIELDARRALSADGADEAAAARVEELRDEDPALYLMYREFIEVNDLVDSNVAGALNSNLAFYRGMATNDTYSEGLSESFILNTVWEQEPEIREEMEEWTMNFSTMAYASLSKAEMQSYIDVSKTPAGQKLNAVLFAGFDAMFEEQSYALGRASAEFMLGEDT